jgi:hypothetical protein
MRCQQKSISDSLLAVTKERNIRMRKPLKDGVAERERKEQRGRGAFGEGNAVGFVLWSFM